MLNRPDDRPYSARRWLCISGCDLRSETKPVIVSEFDPWLMSRAGTNASEFLSILANLSYTFEMIDEESHTVRAITDAELLEGFAADFPKRHEFDLSIDAALIGAGTLSGECVVRPLPPKLTAAVRAKLLELARTCRLK
jgi:hypothetical protein